MNPYSALADSNELIDPTDVKFFKFTGLVPDAKVILQEEPFEVTKYPATVSLFAVSNKNGYYASATTKGFTFGTTKSLRQAIYSANNGAAVTIDKDVICVPLEKPVQQVRFSGDETLLLVSLKGGNLFIYNVNDILTKKEKVIPIESYDWELNIKDLRPNPEALPNLTALLFDDNHCKIIDINTGNTQCDIPVDNISAICWSPKGKQIVCGTTEGQLLHFDAKGVAKSELPIPAAMSAGHGEEETNRYVQDVLWIENHIFLALYSRPRTSDDDDFVNDGYIINRKPTNGSTEPDYIRLAEITPIFTTEGRGNHFYMEVIRDLGKEIKHLVIITNAASTDVSVLGQNEEGEWATWSLPENGLAFLPLSTETSMDTYPLGMAIDYTADEKLPSFDAGDDDTAVDPMPVLYFLNDEGHVCAYHCYNIDLARRGEPYVPPTFSSTAAPVTAPASDPTVAAHTPTVTQTPNFSGFGSTSTSSFGDLLSGKSSTSPTPASSGFSFGSFSSSAAGGLPSFSNLGSAQKIPATPSAGFATAKSSNDTPAAAVPTFGSTTNFGSSANKPAFGAPEVNKPLSSFAKSDQVVPNSESSFGSMSLGQTSTESPKSSFGSFGSSSTTSAFGAAANKPATSAFGSTSSFGSTSAVGGFGSLAKNTVPGATTPTTTPSFGSTATLGSGGFGSLAKNTVPGATAPTTAPSFGSTATLGSGGFGSLAKNTVPGATTPTTTPSFGSTATLGSGGFGSLAKNTVPGATTPTTTPSFGSTATLGSGGFGSLAKNTVPGATTPTTTPSFGSTATLGSGGFGSLAKNTVPGATTPSFGSTATLGSGGFGSLAKNTVPGATTPTTSPSFGSTTTFGGSAEKKPVAKDSLASKPLFGSPTALGNTTFGSTATKTETSPLTKPSEAKSASPVTPTTVKSPVAAKSAEPKPAEVKAAVVAESKPAAVESKRSEVETKQATSEVKGKEKLKPTALDGMGREFELLYINVCEEIDELSSIHEKINDVMKANTMARGQKTEDSLKDKNSVWNLSDVAEYGTLTQNIIASIAEDQVKATKMKESFQSLSAASKKLTDKKEHIITVLGKKFDDKIIDVLDEREMDAETKDELSMIENKAEAYESTLSNMEFKLQEYKKRNKIKNEHNAGELTLYSLHRAIRDIQREIVSRSNDLSKLEEQMAAIKLNENKRRAQQSSGGFSCGDVTDDEEEPEISLEVIKNTTRYIRRFNFLRDVCSQSRSKGPLQCSVE
ncbi:uncharacterized protein EV154DRAFT_605990 [Mucor mucedo]|uniref:uncharacterized protein n=1 Tax=Mucor mucedo TaxID=29922 RepID=UPI00221F7E61|nr:uncharacterized protein EV154DRAFT_605990 [Mucor mucedo]KAI7883402.1 hypothetical protein EV154DRAFT_605990 [Mucor mucedo]